MPVLLFVIVISLVFYLFYKMKSLRSRRPFERQRFTAKSSIALGLFVCLFGINQLFLYQTTVTYLISAIFILLGGYNIYGGIKAYQFFALQAVKEANEWNQHS